MSLILAIESDRRQAWHVAQIAKRLGAELAVAETFENALSAIGNRVPDLILVPALLSPEDDAALKFVLRVVAGTGHVQVLTTPLFGAATARRSARSVLPRFLRGRDEEDLGAGGCEQDEFARQVASYLQAAAQRRATAPATAIVPPPMEMEAPPPTAETMSEPTVLETAALDTPALDTLALDTTAFERLVGDLDALLSAARAVPPPEAQPEPAQPAAPERPAGNEWGLFDPKECGLEALLQKLREEPY